MRACSIIVVSKIYMVQLLKQIVSFILRYLTVNHQGLPHYIKKCLPYSNNLHTLLPLFCSLSGNWSTGKQSFLMWKWCVGGYEVLHCGWLLRNSSARIKEVIFGYQQLWTGCPNSLLRCYLISHLLAFLMSVWFSANRKKKHMTKEKIWKMP